LAKSLDVQLLLLARSDNERLKIEEVYPTLGLTGDAIRVPAGLINGHPTSLTTSALRLPLQWVEACGCRPDWLAAMPVGVQELHLVAAYGGSGAPDLEALADAASVLSQLLERGGGTQRERETSDRIAALVDNLPAPLVFVDSATVQVFLNDRARALLGLTAEEQVRQTAVAEALGALVQAGGSKAVPAFAHAETRDFEISHQGETYKVQTKWIDHGDLRGRVWLFTDVTSENAFRKELAELTNLLQLTVENVSEGVALVDADLRLTLWNEGFIELLGYPSNALYGGADFMALARLTAERGELGGEGVEQTLENIRASLRTQEGRTLELRRDDGRVLEVRRKSLAGGRFILAVRDKTDEHRAARLKDELVSTASHELRTPLTSISGSLALLKSGKVGQLPDGAIRLLDIAKRNSDRLMRLVNDLLDMDKLELGKATFNFAQIDLGLLLREAATQSEPYLERFSVLLRLDLQDEPLIVHADADRLMQVMSNLISNAAKFSPEGSEVTLRLKMAGGHALISVIDRGRGISPEFRKRLFGRFAQEAGPSERGQAGTGLGLAISKAIIERHGGTIELDLDAKVGATFHVMLPLETDEVATAPAAGDGLERKNPSAAASSP
jgi:signal transduction histidine kinase